MGGVKDTTLFIKNIFKMLSITTIKQHLNIDSGYTADDNYLQQLKRVAEAVIEKHINKSLFELETENKGDLPAPIEQAILLLIGNYYNNREAVSYTSANELPLSYNYILDLYKCYYQEKQ